MQITNFNDRYMLTTAVLNGTKTNMRRLEKALECAVTEYEKQYGEMLEIITQYWVEKSKKVCCLTRQGMILLVGTRYKLNEVVAVAQSYEEIRNERFSEPGWTNKLFVRPDLMPHQIQITGVRIERLQAISDDDCLKEGVYYDADVDGYKVLNLTLPNKGWGRKFRQTYFQTPREAFAALINRPGVGRPGLWGKNPWVVVYTFKLIK